MHVDQTDFAFNKPNKKKKEIELSPLFVTENHDFISGWVKQKIVKGNELKLRYVIFTDSKFKFYSDPNKSSPSGILNFNQLSAIVSSIGEKEFSIEIEGFRSSFQFEAENARERED